MKGFPLLGRAARSSAAAEPAAGGPGGAGRAGRAGELARGAGVPRGREPPSPHPIGSGKTIVGKNTRHIDEHDVHEDGADLKTTSNKRFIDSSWGNIAFRSWI